VAETTRADGLDRAPAEGDLSIFQRGEETLQRFLTWKSEAWREETMPFHLGLTSTGGASLGGNLLSEMLLSP